MLPQLAGARPQLDPTLIRASLNFGTPAIFNTDQGVQFTASDFVGCLETSGIRISMDGRGRALDNVFVERLWRSVKYEDIYLKDYACVPELEVGLECYFHFYNYDRPHQSLQYRTPAGVIMPKVRVGLLRAGVQFTTLSSNTALGCALRDSVNHSKVR